MRFVVALLFLLFCQPSSYSQDKKVLKIAKYLEKGDGIESKKLLDELDNKPEYQNDIYFWYVRTVYYRNIALNSNDPNAAASALQEGRKSYLKLGDLDKNSSNSGLSQYFPTLKKDLFEGKNQLAESSNKKQSVSNNNPQNDEKVVTLTQIGQGKTKDAAKYNALRNAIEKAFGIFISSNTTLLQDELVNDEIVSVSSGNVEKFEILSETQMPDGSYSSVVKATISIGKLISFCERKGISVEFKGGLFAANIKLQELNKKNEEAVMKNLNLILTAVAKKGIDFNIEVSDPIRYDYNNSYWLVPLKVKAKFNSNMAKLSSIIESTFKGLALNEIDVEAFQKQNLPYYSVQFNGIKYLFRSEMPQYYLRYFTNLIVPREVVNFEINNGIYTKSYLEFASCIADYEGIEGPRERNLIESKCSFVRYNNRLLKIEYSFGERDYEGQYRNYNWADLKIGEYIRVIHTEYAHTNHWTDIEISRWNSAKYDFTNTNNNEFIFSFFNFLSISDLEKVTGYKVQPIIK